MVYEFDFDALPKDPKETIAKTTPDEVTDLQKQQELIAIAKEATRINLQLTVLERQIEKLGDIAAALARKSLH